MTFGNVWIGNREITMSSIFINYRRSDAGGHAGRLWDRLLMRFNREQIFYDLGTIESGTSFPKEIQNALDSARVFLAVIGPDWFSPENRKRLHDEKDFVRREIAFALKRRKEETIEPPLVIPVMVGGAKMPESAVLPEDIRSLTELEYHELHGTDENYSRQIEELYERIEFYCHDAWITRYNTWFLEGVTSNDYSFARFHQDISVLCTSSHFVERKAAKMAMDDWWSTWNKHRHPFVLTGEEGDGKSWALAFWAAARLSDPNFNIPILFVPALKFNSAESKGLESAMVDALERAAYTISKPQWAERLRFLLQRKESGKPQILLVVDGLNERPTLDWRVFFDIILASPFRDNAAVMVTCRTAYWKLHLGLEFDSRSTSLLLPHFNGPELDEALAHYSFTRNNFSQKVLDLIAKPRYLNMAIRLRARLEEAGDDITVERLIYEDWRDMISRKRGLTAPMPHEEFHRLIAHLVGTYGKRISYPELGRELSGYGDITQISSELVSSGILQKKDANVEVSRKHLILGFGLLLANEIEESGEVERKEIEEIISTRMEPHSDMDLKIQVGAMALSHALLTEDYPDAGRLALFRSWIHGRNLDETDIERICAYLPLRPATYFRMAEEIWNGTFDNHQAQDLFMIGFLRHKDIARVRAEMIPTFEKWLGLVYLYGYWGHFKKEPKERDDLLVELEKRLGGSAKLGPAALLGYQLQVVDDENLLRLGQVAVTVISHCDRQPFIRALLTGFVATAVMDGSNTEFEWVIRTASGQVKHALYQEALKLIGLKERIAFEAADRILFAICSEDAIALRNSIPEQFRLKYGWREIMQKEDICKSPLYLWNEDNYFECIQKTELPPILIAEKLRIVATNPDCTLSPEYISRIEKAAHLIDLKQVGAGMGQTREDHCLRDIEPALCAYSPAQYAELIHRLAKTLRERDGFSRRTLAYNLYKHMPVLEDEEREIVQDVWRTSLHGKEKDDSDAEIILFPIIIFNRPGPEQLTLLQERDGKTIYLGDHAPCFRPLEKGSHSLIEKALSNINAATPEKYYTILWYLQKTLAVLDDALRQRILTLFAQGDSIIRYCCLKIICRTNDQLAADRVIASGWQAGQEGQRSLEVSWGSILLSRFAQHLPYLDLVARISPEWFGYAVKRRGNKPQEVETYNLLLHGLWLRIAHPKEDIGALLRHVRINVAGKEHGPVDEISINLNADKPLKMENYTWGGTAGKVSHDEVKRAFDLQAAEEDWKIIYKQILTLFENEKKRGNHWIDTSFSEGNLEVIVANAKPFWHEWISPIMAANDEGRRLLASCQGLYESLCKALMNFEPETGVKLFRVIINNKAINLVDSLTGIQHLYFDLFEAQDSPQMTALREEILQGCDSDQSLFEIVLLVQKSEKKEWLNEIIQKWIESEWDFNKARGLRLLGFSDDQTDAEKLQFWIEMHSSSWLMDVAKSALRCHNRNLWARSWFERFMAQEDRVLAWAAFRLFLRCVDRRFWKWGQDMLTSKELPQWKKDAYIANIGTIKDAVKENEKKLKETFIGHDVKNNQLWPWMQNYISS